MRWAILVAASAFCAPALVGSLSAVAPSGRLGSSRRVALMPAAPAGRPLSVLAAEPVQQATELKAEAAAASDVQGGAWEAFSQALVIVFSAEMFDKTWFVTLLYSLNAGARVAFSGSFLALVIHTVISAGLGAALAKVLSRWLLHMLTAVIFATFASFYAYECYQASPDEDAMEGRTKEAREELGEEEHEPVKDSKAGKGLRSAQAAMTQVFIAVFIAEWGDRTQVAMVSLHASLPILPVVLGSLLAFFLSCISAVALAAVLSRQRISERTISGVSAVSFLVFSVVALVSGLQDLRAFGPAAIAPPVASLLGEA